MLRASVEGRGVKPAVLWLVRRYQARLSPELGARCRYYPTCSEYAHDSGEKHGTARGLWMAARRIARCHPFAVGGFDPVP